MNREIYNEKEIKIFSLDYKCRKLLLQESIIKSRAKLNMFDNTNFLCSIEFRKLIN